MNKEGDLVAIQNIKNIGFLGGLTKKRKNEISLTSKGQKLLQSDSEKDLLELFFRVNCQKLRMWGYKLPLAIACICCFDMVAKRRRLTFIAKSI